MADVLHGAATAVEVGAAASVDASPGPARGRLPKLVCVDWLRGIAAVLVVVHHATTFFYRGNFEGLSRAERTITTFLTQGATGVAVFFVISGFCIHLPHVGLPRLQYKAFAIRRFWRLYPPYVLVTCVALVLMYIAYRHQTNPATYLRYSVGHLFFWYYGGGAKVGVSPVLWTIAVEVQFYLLYALMFPILRRIGIPTAALLFLVADLAYRLLMPAVQFPDTTGIPLKELLAPEAFAPTRFGEWLLGAWIAEAVITGRLQNASGLFAKPASWIGIGIIVLVVGCVLSTTPRGDACFTMMTCVATALALTGMAQAEMAGRTGRSAHRLPLGRWLADRSYSLYLVHYTVIASLGIVAAKLFHIADRNAMARSPLWFGVMLSGVIGSFIVADLMYRFVESPSHRLARRLAAGA